MNDHKTLSKAFEKVNKHIAAKNDNPVIRFKDPADLKSLIPLSIGEKGVCEQDFLSLIDQYLNYSVNTSNKQFLNQLYSGFNFPAFIGEMCTALTNTSMYTFEVAPVATLIENEIIDLMNRYAGYDEGDGTFVSGGSNANMLAMLSARNKLIPECRTNGVDNTLKLRAFVSDQAHYSFETAANVIGIGADSVIKVKSDKEGRLIPLELEKEIQKALISGEMPFFVAATSATTLLGAYDPLDEMAKICKKYKIWLHADGSFGGSILLSDKHKHLMKGIEQTDSLSWNPHKLMNIPLICSALLVKAKGTLQHNITDINTDYIFHDIEPIDDLGKKSIQCGRRVDAVKLWFAWKYFGLEGYRRRIDNLINMAIYAEQIVINESKLELLASRQSFAVCFKYLPNNKCNDNDFNLRLREELRKKGQSIVNYSYIGEVLAIRLITANGELLKEDIKEFFDNFLIAGKDLETKTINKNYK